MAAALAARGFDLVLVARRERALARLSNELAGRHSVRCDVLVADLTDQNGLDATADRIREQSFTTVVNNAGYGSVGFFHELPLDQELGEIQLNVSALVALSHAALEMMVPRRSGNLLNVASTASFQPGPKNATYSATKAFVRSFTEAIHEEVLSSGVHVTALCPGFTRTGFQSRAGMEATNVPGVMWAEPEAVALAGLSALERNQAVCVPGIVNKVGAASVRIAPRSVARKMAGQVLKRM